MSEKEPLRSIDHTPKTSQEKTFFEEADKVYSFMNQIYTGYARMRFRGAPFMLEPEEDLKGRGQESIADHMWAATLFFRVMLPLLPHAEKTINKYLVKEFLEVHDIGEIANGDISAVLQLQGHGKDKEQVEWDVYTSLVSQLPEVSQKDLLTQKIYEEEKTDGETSHKEALIAKMFDTMQGDHYVLTHSINFLEHADLHEKIVSTRLVPYAKRLEEVFISEKNLKAAEDIRLLMKHHLYQYQKRSVNIPY